MENTRHRSRHGSLLFSHWVILCDSMNSTMPGFPVLHYLLEFAHNSSPLSQWCFVKNILCCPFRLLPSIFPSIRVFSSESALCISWLKYWSFSFSISPSNEYSEWVSFSINWFDLLAVQGTLKSLLQLHSSKESILWLSAFFMAQLSHIYMTTRKTIALIIQWVLKQNQKTTKQNPKQTTPIHTEWYTQRLLEILSSLIEGL